MPKATFKSDEPTVDCSLCARLTEFRLNNQAEFPDWFNAPVPSFGSENAELLIVGLAPGLKGANKTGRPFTGDYAGDLLYQTLLKFNFASGSYKATPDDGLCLINTMITNAVRCVPPQNKPIGAEIKTCRNFLTAKLNNLQNLKVIIALGRIAHESVVLAVNSKQKNHPFGHGAISILPTGHTLIDSYHCSRYNTNTGRLTTEMFENIFTKATDALNAREL